MAVTKTRATAMVVSSQTEPALTSSVLESAWTDEMFDRASTAVDARAASASFVFDRPTPRR